MSREGKWASRWDPLVRPSLPEIRLDTEQQKSQSETIKFSWAATNKRVGDTPHRHQHPILNDKSAHAILPSIHTGSHVADTCLRNVHSTGPGCTNADLRCHHGISPLARSLPSHPGNAHCGLHTARFQTETLHCDTSPSVAVVLGHGSVHRIQDLSSGNFPDSPLPRYPQLLQPAAHETAHLGYLAPLLP